MNISTKPNKLFLIQIDEGASGMVRSHLILKSRYKHLLYGSIPYPNPIGAEAIT